MTYTQLMIDIETMGTRSYAALVSIAAVPFNWDGSTGTPFSVDIDLNSCLQAKLRIDASTLQWWLKQSEAARAKIYNSQGLPLKSAIEQIKCFIADVQPEGIWGNGSRFDLGLIENAADSIGVKALWKFWTERDVRTLVSFGPEIKDTIPFRGTAHTPVDDCLHQIEYCCAIYNKLKF